MKKLTSDLKLAIYKAIDMGYVRQERHATHPLTIYNYTQKAQFEWVWNEVTTLCRGLIVHDDGTIVSRPFSKFFSLDQLGGKLPRGQCDIFEKLDGSLGVSYFVDGVPFIATRGSFVSDQAREGTRMLWDRLIPSGLRLIPEYTYCFEIIYPENQIVVDYDGERRLVLLAVFDTETGLEVADITAPSLFETPEYFGRDSSDKLTRLIHNQIHNREGYVLRFDDGTRVKIKFDEYKRRHKILTGVSEQIIWEAMQLGQLQQLRDSMPDQWILWFTGISNRLARSFGQIETDCQKIADQKLDRRVVATLENSSVIFAMMDGKEYRSKIWRLLKPSGELVFKNKRACGDES